MHPAQSILIYKRPQTLCTDYDYDYDYDHDYDYDWVILLGVFEETKRKGNFSGFHRIRKSLLEHPTEIQILFKKSSSIFYIV